MWQKQLKISPIVLNAALILVAGAVLFVQKPSISLNAKTYVNYDQVASVEGDPSWEILFSRVLSAQNESIDKPESKTANPKPTVKPVKPTPVPTQAPTKAAKQVVPVSTTTQTTSTNIESIIRQAASEYGVNGDVMVEIARCESGLRASAVNGPYGGIFQFLASTWASNRRAMGLDPNQDLRFNAQEAAKTAAFKMARDGFGAWPACSRKVLGVAQKI